MESEKAEDLQTSYVYYPADPKAILDDLFRLMQKDSTNGYTYWELTDELDSMLHFNKAEVQNTISNQFQQKYGDDSVSDLLRLTATVFVLHKILLCYNKIIDKLEDSIENSNMGNFLDQSRIIEDKCADFFQFLVESARVVPLENVQNVVAAAYFCIHKFTRYPEFLKKCSDENWRASFKFFSMIGDYLCRE